MKKRAAASVPQDLSFYEYDPSCPLPIVDTMSNNSIARDFFGTLQNLYVFIETCTKRHAMYLKHKRELNASEEGKKKREYVLKKLSDTRWACRADSITAIYHTLEAVIATLKEIRENEKNGFGGTILMTFMKRIVIYISLFISIFNDNLMM